MQNYIVSVRTKEEDFGSVVVTASNAFEAMQQTIYTLVGQEAPEGAILLHKRKKTMSEIHIVVTDANDMQREYARYTGPNF